jgi:hypothetical protein
VSTDANVGSNPTARTSNQGDIVEEFNSNDIVNLLRMRACPSAGEYLESDHGHSDCYLEREAADEIERLRSLISEWVDAQDKRVSDGGYDPRGIKWPEADTELRKAVGR